MADRITGEPFATRSEVLGKNGMVATSQPLAAQAGLDILKGGGNAVDAAIAVNACLGLMEPTGCGIGGDLFVLLWDAKSRQLHGLNASGRSAEGASLDDMGRLLKSMEINKIPNLGPLSVSIPGCVDGWSVLHERFGQLPMDKVLAPAIQSAREGFPVTEVIAHYWAATVETRAQYPGFLEALTLDGRAPAKGEIWKNPDLADTYAIIAELGRDAFYTGDMARVMAEFLEKHGSFLRYEDFAGHTSEWVKPISTNYRGYDVWELPPNGQGLAALQILNILEGFDFSQPSFGCVDHLHAFIEAKKLAYHDRALEYADPHFHEVPLERLLSKDYASSQRKQINPMKAALNIPPDPDELRQGDTVYLATADSEGNMVSFIQSNYRGVGSGLFPPGLGFGFQSRGSGFSMDPEHANAYAPAKRPFHTIIPAFIAKDDQPLCAFGVMGGDTQPQAHAQIVMNMVDFGMNLQEAGDAPRIVHSGDSDPSGTRMLDGGHVALESGFPPDAVNELKARGHSLIEGKGSFGGYQAVWRDPETGVYAGASESRKDGQAVGY
ncbi:MAG: gamma-glutamyltransferase [Puniceicoccaceae bacterium]